MSQRTFHLAFHPALHFYLPVTPLEEEPGEKPQRHAWASYFNSRGERRGFTSASIRNPCYYRVEANQVRKLKDKRAHRLFTLLELWKSCFSKVYPECWTSRLIWSALRIDSGKTNGRRKWIKEASSVVRTPVGQFFEDHLIVHLSCKRIWGG